MLSDGIVALSAAVEGDVDEATVRRIADHLGVAIHAVYGKRGKPHLLQKLGAYNNAARFAPWLVLIDLNQDAKCAPPFRTRHLSDPARHMCFRVAVHEVESWLMADRRRLASFLGVPIARIPANPELDPDPKQTIVSLARNSRRATIRRDVAPRLGSGRTIGPLYTSRLIEFVTDAQAGWRPEIAAKACPSLARCLRALRDLAPAPQG
jgi:hypothetical protein